MNSTIKMNAEEIVNQIDSCDISAEYINFIATNIDKILIEIRNFYDHLPLSAINNLTINVVKTVATCNKVSGGSLAAMYKVLNKASFDIPSIDSIFVDSDNCNSELLDILSNSPHWGIKLSVTKHKNASPETLERLSCDDSLKNTLSKNRNCSESLLERLATDDMIIVQINVFKNPSSPLHVKMMTAEHAKDLIDDLLKEIEEQELIKAVKNEELSLERSVQTKSGLMNFGDFLLKNNLIEYFHLIQSLELKASLERVSACSPTLTIEKTRKAAL
ncbi:hypothetical protein ACEUAI_13105 [Aeromonas veronii]